MSKPKGKTSNKPATPPPAPAMSPAEEDLYKQVRKLKKQLEQAQSLKQKVDAGELVANAEQSEKIKKIGKLVKELEELQPGSSKDETTTSNSTTPPPSTKLAPAATPTPQVAAEDAAATAVLITDAEVAARCDRGRLDDLLKEYDAVCTLRSNILSGKIATPTKVQLAQVKTAELLKKELHTEEERYKCALERTRLMMELEAEEAMNPPKPPTPPPPAPAPPVESPKASKKEKEASPKHGKKQATPPPEPEPEVVPEPVAAPAAPVVEEKVEEEEEEAPKKIPSPKAQKGGKGDKGGKGGKKEQKPPTPDPEPEPESPIGGGEEEGQYSGNESPTAAEDAPPVKKVRKEFDPLNFKFVQNKSNIKSAKPVDDDGNGATNGATSGSEAKKFVEEFPKQVTEPYTVKLTTPSAAAPAAPPVEAAPAKQAGGKGGKQQQPQKEKGGKGGAAAPSAGNPAYALIQQSAAARLAKDWAEVQSNPLPNVRATLVKDNLFVWHVNVSPYDGPLAGYVIHIALHFPDSYPLIPPQIKTFADIPHPHIYGAEFSRTTLWLDVCDTKPQGGKGGWSMAYGALNILSSLQNIFSADSFGSAKKLQNFVSKLKVARGELLAHKCGECGHNGINPQPYLTVQNGPFLPPLPEELTVTDNSIQWYEAPQADAEGPKVAGHYWIHSFTGKGKFVWRATIEGAWAEGEAVRVGYCNEEADVRALGAEGTKSDWTIPVTTSGVTVDCILDLDAATLSFSGEGHKTFTELSSEEAYYPCFSLPYGAILRATFCYPTNSVADPLSLAPKVSSASKPAPTTTAPSATISCFATRRSQDEDVLGVAIQVERQTVAPYLPLSLRTTLDIISLLAFEKENIRKSSTGAHIDAVLPLGLSPAHATKAIPAIKSLIATLTRDPKVSTFYDPPFRVANAIKVYNLFFHTAVADYYYNRKSAEQALRAVHAIGNSLLALANAEAKVKAEYLPKDADSIGALVLSKSDSDWANAATALLATISSTEDYDRRGATSKSISLHLVLQSVLRKGGRQAVIPGPEYDALVKSDAEVLLADVEKLEECATWDDVRALLVLS